MLAVSGSAESRSTSEQCVEVHNPQPYRVWFEQVTASLGAARPVQEARSIYKVPLTLEGEPIDEMEVVHLAPGVHKVLLVIGESANGEAIWKPNPDGRRQRILICRLRSIHNDYWISRELNGHR
jgi:hypothetical protein